MAEQLNVKRKPSSQDMRSATKRARQEVTISQLPECVLLTIFRDLSIADSFSLYRPDRDRARRAFPLAICNSYFYEVYQQFLRLDKPEFPSKSSEFHQQCLTCEQQKFFMSENALELLNLSYRFDIELCRGNYGNYTCVSQQHEILTRLMSRSIRIKSLTIQNMSVDLNGSSQVQQKQQELQQHHSTLFRRDMLVKHLKYLTSLTIVDPLSIDLLCNFKHLKSLALERVAISSRESLNAYLRDSSLPLEKISILYAQRAEAGGGYRISMNQIIKLKVFADVECLENYANHRKCLMRIAKHCNWCMSSVKLTIEKNLEKRTSLEYELKEIGRRWPSEVDSFNPTKKLVLEGYVHCKIDSVNLDAGFACPPHLLSSEYSVIFQRGWNDGTLIQYPLNRSIPPDEETDYHIYKLKKLLRVNIEDILTDQNREFICNDMGHIIYNVSDISCFMLNGYINHRYDTDLELVGNTNEQRYLLNRILQSCQEKVKMMDLVIKGLKIGRLIDSDSHNIGSHPTSDSALFVKCAFRIASVSPNLKILRVDITFLFCVDFHGKKVPLFFSKLHALESLHITNSYLTSNYMCSLAIDVIDNRHENDDNPYLESELARTGNHAIGLVLLRLLEPILSSIRRTSRRLRLITIEKSEWLTNPISFAQYDYRDNGYRRGTYARNVQAGAKVGQSYLDGILEELCLMSDDLKAANTDSVVECLDIVDNTLTKIKQGECLDFAENVLAKIKQGLESRRDVNSN